jgi:hypothetical protein
LELSKNLCINDHDASPSTSKLFCRVAPWVGCHQLSASCHWRLVSSEFAATTHPPAFDKWGFLNNAITLFVEGQAAGGCHKRQEILSLYFNFNKILNYIS